MYSAEVLALEHAEEYDADELGRGGDRAELVAAGEFGRGGDRAALAGEFAAAAMARRWSPSSRLSKSHDAGELGRGGGSSTKLLAIAASGRARRASGRRRSP